MITRFWRKIFPLKVHPEIVGRQCAVAIFDDWPSQRIKIEALISPLKPDEPDVFDVELVTLRNFAFSYGIYAKQDFIKSEQQTKKIDDAYFQTVANLLMGFGWKKDQFILWNEIRQPRYDGYRKSIETNLSFSDPSIGLTFLRHALGRDILGADQVISLKISITFAYWILAVAKTFEGCVLVD